MCIGEGTYSECQGVVIISRRTHLSKTENMSLITMPIIWLSKVALILAVMKQEETSQILKCNIYSHRSILLNKMKTWIFKLGFVFILYYFRKKLQALEILCALVEEESGFYSSLKEYLRQQEIANCHHIWFYLIFLKYTAVVFMKEGFVDIYITDSLI